MTRRGRTLPVISQPSSKIGAPMPVGVDITDKGIA
jgi:hypothetical protein